MSILSKTAFAALLLGSTIAAPVFAASPDTAGCPAGMHRAEAEGVGSGQTPTRRAEAEGVGSGQTATRRAEAEGVGSGQTATRRAEAEGVGSGGPTQATRKAEAEGAPGYQRQASAAAPCIK